MKSRSDLFHPTHDACSVQKVETSLKSPNNVDIKIFCVLTATQSVLDFEMSHWEMDQRRMF